MDSLGGKQALSLGEGVTMQMVCPMGGIVGSCLIPLPHLPPAHPPILEIRPIALQMLDKHYH